ncbi:MAG: 2-dehydro-3-deoxy-D-arabinonate dehydratase [Verrucomicrobiales bacterium]|jgi:2-dehydro-3-deoxy-D-arabinonate dehydratase
MIEGENPFYPPQAKVYRGSCALGPALCVCDPLPKETKIHLSIFRDGQVAFEDETALTQLKRTFEQLAEFLFRDNEFPDGCWLMTGTGIVPSTDFTLQSGDVVKIAIDGLGVLEHTFRTLPGNLVAIQLRWRSVSLCSCLVDLVCL